MSQVEEQVDDETTLHIRSVAESGNVDSPWETLQRLLRCRLDHIIDSYQARQETKENQLDEPNVEKFDLNSSREEILELIDSFNEPPFTIQRICELLYSPFKYYDRVSTFIRGLEKNLRVISSNDWPKCPAQATSLNISNNQTSETTSGPKVEIQGQSSPEKVGEETVETAIT